jgi:hypothetical protein
VLDEPSAGLDPIVAAELDELILLLKEALQMTVIVVTHELPSAFRIADRIAMLYQGSFSSVGTKDELKASQNPRVRQFLDRVPENIAKTPAVAAYFEKYMQSRGGLPVTTEAKVGAFVLGCFSILAFTLIYLINAQFSGHTVPYRTYLRYAGGLEPGASVLFGGINVGKVTAVRPALSPTLPRLKFFWM